MNESKNADFEALLNYIKHSRGFDFTGYKRSSLMRRVMKRMQAVQIEQYSEYLDYLEVHPEEFNHLFNTLLINVTSFFRDREVWDYLRSEILPRILQYKSPNEQIRVWSAGCASGQEAFSIAIALFEQLGIEQFQNRVKIYATDVDEEALNQGRHAFFSERELAGLSNEQIDLYFDRSDDRYAFHKDLRRAVIFGRHDLIQDAPISKIDLLICRNTLMYFNAETQSRILTRFHFALRDGGFLFLGKAEMLLTHANTFTPIDLRSRVFTKVSTLNLRDRMLALSNLNSEVSSNPLSNHIRLREAGFDAGVWAQIIIDPAGTLALANARARQLFNLLLQDLGRPLQDLEVSYRPVELRSCIEKPIVLSAPSPCGKWNIKLHKER